VGDPRRYRLTIPLVLFAVAASSFAVWAMFLKPAMDEAKDALCRANLVKLRHALFEYDGMHGALPPAYVTGADGKPAHSWRALIMPYLDSLGIDAKAFNANYDFKQPWDAPANAKSITPVRDSRFACPCDPECDTTYTSYVVLTGDHTLFPGSRSRALSDIPKSHDPILIIEIDQSDIVWTEPRDLPLESIATQSPSNRVKLSRSHPSRIRYITASGKYGSLPVDTAPNEIRRLAELPH
jgi:hypothetical protein